MAISLCTFFSFLCLAAVTGVLAAEQEECKPARCQESEPEVRFPWWLKDRQPHYCGYSHPDFELSCSPSNITVFYFHNPTRSASLSNLSQLGLNFQVVKINYASQLLHLSILMGDCLPPRFLSEANFSASASPFELLQPYAYAYDNLTFFNCSSSINISMYPYLAITCFINSPVYQVLVFTGFANVWNRDFSSCTKMYSVYSAPIDAFPRNKFYYLQWLRPSCGDCSARGKYCRLKSNSTGDETECYDLQKQPPKGLHRKLVKAVVVGALFLVLAMLTLLYSIFSLKKKKEGQKKIEKFFDDYKALKPTRFSYADIKKITDKFKEKLGEGGYGTVYKGKLSDDILVAVKLLNNFKGNGEEFINEVGTIGTIHHKNVVRLVGYCADGYRRALLYEFLPNDSLERIISSRKRINSLGWEKLQQIAIGIAKGLHYLHQGCDQRILHFDIKPQNILLDQNFNPKVADFGLAKLCSKDQSAVSMTAARGTIGYIAPEVFSRNFGNVSYKSDVYGFGMLLLDIVGGRKRFEAAREEESSQIYYPEWMYKQLEKGEELEIQIDNEEDNRIFKKLAIVGLWCIQWCPADRPSVRVAIQMLEEENMPAMPPNPFAAANSTTANAFTSGSSNPSSGEICTISETN